MVVAVKAAIEGKRKDWRSGNTVVRTDHDSDLGNVVVVELHGNKIAEFDVSCAGVADLRGLMITDAGWKTATTKSRLNALLTCFCDGGGIWQVNGDWFLNSVEFHGQDWLSYGWKDSWASQAAEAVAS